MKTETTGTVVAGVLELDERKRLLDRQSGRKPAGDWASRSSAPAAWTTSRYAWAAESWASERRSREYRANEFRAREFIASGVG